MKDRIKLIMEKENLTPAKFADRLQINRAVISHILNGRNNPSLDVVTKILSEMNYINTEWLINGTGNMYKDGFTESKSSLPKLDLFNQDITNRPELKTQTEELREKPFKQEDNMNQLSENKSITSIKNNVKKITQIIIYYDDNTFEIFGPNSKQ